MQTPDSIPPRPVPLLTQYTHQKPSEKSIIYVPYDRLVVAAGSVISSKGVRGLENCARPKTIHDAEVLHKRLIENLEVASRPESGEMDQHELLSTGITLTNFLATVSLRMVDG